jgi:hypothetical protein
VALQDGHGREYTIGALRNAALANVALHLVGLAFAAVSMRAGTPAAPLDARVAYLAARPPGWTLGWLTWILCAVAVVAFMRALACAIPSARTRAATGLALAGAAVDVACDLLYAFALPARAAAGPEALTLLERPLGLASLTVANGLYSAAVLVSTLGLPTGASLARALGVLTFAGGMVLAAAGLGGDPRLALAGTALAIPSFMAWTLAVSSSRPR